MEETLQQIPELSVTIPTGNLAIETNFGLKVLSQYIHESEQVQMFNATIADIGYSERRAQSVTKIVEVVNDKKPFQKDRIAIVDLTGIIKSEDGLSSFGTRTKGEQLLSYQKDVIGALFRIDSGGGYMDGAETMIAAMREFGKPIVVLSRFAASAAYMIAAEAQQIFAETKFSEFGSIGTYIPLSLVQKELLVKYVRYAYSTKSPNKNIEERAWLENDDISGFVERATLKDEMFMNFVKDRRRLKQNKTMEETLAGGLFHAEDAKERGLIDGIKGMQDAIKVIQTLTRI